MMPTCVLHLHDGPHTAPRTETLDASDDQEARSLALPTRSWLSLPKVRAVDEGPG